MVAYPISEAWGKTNERLLAELRRWMEKTGKWIALPPRSWHPLRYHCLDVAMVALAIMSMPVFRKRLEAAAGRSLDDVDLQRLVVIIALHDAGKASPPFYRKAFEQTGADHDLVFLKEVRRHLYDGSRSNIALAAGVERMLAWTGDGQALMDLFSAVVHHHGGPRQMPEVYVSAASAWEPVVVSGREHRPLETLEGLMRDIEGAFPLAFGPVERPLPAGTGMIHLLAAITMAADWAASTERLFPYNTGTTEDRVAAIATMIDQAVLEIGLGVAPALSPDFPDISVVAEAVCGGRAPRPLQEIVRDLPLSARLLLLEDATGAGKTEAGLIWAVRLLAAGEVSGLCFALPTRTSAAQIYSRIRALCKTLMPGLDPDRDIVCAIPGYDPRDQQVGDEQAEEEAQRVATMEDAVDTQGGARRTIGWAAESSKKFLAAPIVVGTIDQVLLSGIRVRHAHLRAAFLARHLLVIDEVHASDPYMAQLTAEVVNRQIALGSRVLLMSATLGASARRLYTGEAPVPIEEAVAAPYPLATACDVQAVAPAVQRSRRRSMRVVPENATGAFGAFSLRCTPVPIGRIDRKSPRVSVAGMERILETMRACVAGGGRVLVIKSTTRSARRMLRAVQDAGLPVLMVAGKPALHHSRFAREDRLLLDHAIEVALAPGRCLSEDGEDGRRPGGLVCIATQTAEQSLDIDADLLVTDPAPADVLIQRLGRLHRHLRTERPPGFVDPLAFIVDPGNFDNYLRPPRPREASPRYVQAQDGMDFALVYDNLLAVRRTVEFFQAGGPEGRLFRPYDDARTLVEACTDWSDLADEYTRMPGSKADLWRRLGERIFAEGRVRVQTAGMAVLDWRLPFDEQLVGQPDERVSARLGIDEVTVEFHRGIFGPFGRPISSLSIRRSWLSGGVVDDPCRPEELETVVDDNGSEWLRFMVGGKSFRYDSLGCRKDSRADDTARERS